MTQHSAPLSLFAFSHRHRSGIVNVIDLLAVVGAWGSCTSCPADTNGDGMVNIVDLLAVVANWG
ncbi:MAG: hypothetical protein L0219_21215 [Phycisphaerales bacterium]|nr:hypothetical protein [Phycisphaerales bacterium]